MITDTTGLYAIHYYMMQSSSQRGPETLGSKGVAKNPNQAPTPALRRAMASSAKTRRRFDLNAGLG